jgi:transposase
LSQYAIGTAVNWALQGAPIRRIAFVLLAYSRGIISSRKMEAACLDNVMFMVVSGESRPDHSTRAAFVAKLGGEVAKLFTQVLVLCDSQGLIGREMFAIDGAKLASNASKARSGTRARRPSYRAMSSARSPMCSSK